MSRNIFWNPKLADELLEENAIKRLNEAAEMMAEEVRESTPVGNIDRPMYKTGPYKDQYWTSRDAGSLKQSVRVTHSEDGDGNTLMERFNRNVWVMCGNKKAYYGKIIEHGTNGNKYQGFFRKAINRSKRKATAILQGA